MTVHIPDGLVDVPTAAAGAVVAAGGVAIAGRRTAARLRIAPPPSRPWSPPTC